MTPRLLLTRLGIRPALPSPAWVRRVAAARLVAGPAARRASFTSNALAHLRSQRSAAGRRLRSRRWKSDSAPSRHPDPTPHLGSPEPAPSLSQRLKQLSKEYGWTALGVYLALSVLDFPFCFLAVRLLGTDRIGHYEEVVRRAFWSLVGLAFPAMNRPAPPATDVETPAEATAREGKLSSGELAMQKASSADASIWTQLGLAYLVHKSFIFFRVPLTAAVLPKVVKTLRSWGYNVGRKKPKTA